MDKKEYERLKPLILEYESKLVRLGKIKGVSVCPFCSGSKTTPFIRPNKSQLCIECDENGNIKNSRLVELDLK